MNPDAQRNLDAFTTIAKISRDAIAHWLKKMPLDYDGICRLIYVYHSLFEELTILTTIQSRHGAANPRAMLKEVVTVAKEVIPYYRQLKKKDRAAHRFNFAVAALFSRFFQPDFDAAFIELLIPAAEFPDDITETPLTPLLDTCLTLTLTTHNCPSIWNDLIRQIGGAKKRRSTKAVSKRKPKVSLFAQTFQCYMDIIQASFHNEWDLAHAKVMHAYTLYDQRRTDSDYKNSFLINAGGDMADCCMDFRLASLIHICFQPRPDLLASFPPPHAWNF